MAADENLDIDLLLSLLDTASYTAA